MHVAMVYMDGHKMSKSLGNLVFVDKLRTEWDPRAIRLGIIEHHYRYEWEWDEQLMPRNRDRVLAWSASAQGADAEAVLDDVRAALDDDLNTPAAVAVIDAAAAAGRGVGAAAALLGRLRPYLERLSTVVVISLTDGDEARAVERGISARGITCRTLHVDEELTRSIRARKELSFAGHTAAHATGRAASTRSA
jgi:cysteinyl-tRNA synthetase